MNKTSKHNNCSKTANSTRYRTLLHGDSSTSRTPRNNQQKLQLKFKHNLKSIPIIPYKDI
jgi:hypothetical protein